MIALVIFLACSLAMADEQPVYGIYDSGVERFEQADVTVSDATFESDDVTVQRTRIVELHSVLKTYPEYPFRGEAWYFIGYHHYLLEQDASAIKAFEMARSIRPSLNMKTPVKRLIAKASERLFRKRITATCRWSIGMICVICLIVGIWTRAWKGVSKRWCVVTLALCLAWFIAAAVMALWTPNYVPEPDVYAEPILIQSALGHSGSFRLTTLLTFGTVAAMGSLLIGFSLLRLRPWMRISFQPVLSIGLAVALLSLFHLKTCREFGQLSPQKPGLVGWLSSHYVFVEKVISDPSEVPEEMYDLYDADVLEEIRAAKDFTESAP